MWSVNSYRKHDEHIFYFHKNIYMELYFNWEYSTVIVKMKYLTIN